jgi:hypothetical protein
MLNKIYLAFLGIASVVMIFFTLYSQSWLSSIGDPKTAAENYSYWANLNWTFLWFSSVVLLVFANILLWKMRRGWAMWTTLVYFAVFTVISYFWLEPNFFAFKKTNGLWKGEFSLSQFFGVGLIVVAAVIVFLNHFLNLRLNEKMFPPKEPETDLQLIEEVQS